jgi:hypothetical protein
VRRIDGKEEAKKEGVEKMSKLTTEPGEKVEFKGTWEEPVTTELKVVNSSGKRMAYKVKCTSNELFKIRPVMGILGDGESATVTLTFSPKDKKAPIANHHFTITEFEPKDEEKNARKVWEAEEAKKSPAAKKIKAEFAAAEGAAPAADKPPDADKKPDDAPKPDADKKEEEKK